MPEEPIALIVQAGGERLDKFVTAHLEGVSRTQVQRWIDEGHLQVGGRPRPANYRLQAGDQIEIQIPPTEPAGLSAEPIPLEILYEDEDLIVLNKPAGLVVHPAAGHSSGTLVNALLHHAPDLAVGDEERPGIVHRLDRDTSGVMVVAKNDLALRNLQDQFRSREVKKIYLAIVQGKPDTLRGRIAAPIGRDPRHRQKMAVRTEARARAAETEFQVRAFSGSYALLELAPRTGRTHQIRVHLAFIGHPVAGDPVYGGGGGPAIAGRQLLHAWKISFLHPRQGNRLEFTARPPEDFCLALRFLSLEPAGEGPCANRP